MTKASYALRRSSSFCRSIIDVPNSSVRAKFHHTHRTTAMFVAIRMKGKARGGTPAGRESDDEEDRDRNETPLPECPGDSPRFDGPAHVHLQSDHQQHAAADLAEVAD